MGSSSGSSSGSKAWTDAGEAGFAHGIPWRVIRSLVLRYKGIIKSVTQLTLNGSFYDISKQAKEGMVIVGNGYGSVSFILPDNREQISAEEAASMNVYDYLVMLGDTEYGEVPAWDYFAAFVADMMSSLMGDASEDTTIDVTALPYTLSVDGLQWSGVGDFSTVTTARAYFHTLYNGLPDNGISTVMLSDVLDSTTGAACITLSIDVGAEAGNLEFPMYIGVK